MIGNSPSDLSVGSPYGDNRPPADADPLLERLSEQHADIKERADQLLEAEARLPDSLTDATVGAVSDYVRQIKACAKWADDTRKAEKEPFLVAGRTVDGWAARLIEPLKAAAKRAEGRVAAFLRARELEERRRMREEAERLAAEAKALRAAGDRQQAQEIRAEARDLREHARDAKAADLVRTHTGMGGVSTLQTVWEFQILDLDRIDLETLRPHLAVEALEKAIRAYIRAGGRQLAGVDIYQDRRASIR